MSDEKTHNNKIPIWIWIVGGAILILFCSLMLEFLFSFITTDNEQILDISDCPKAYTGCNGTTQVYVYYKLVNNKCVEESLSEYNSFSCGYKVPCDPIECNNKSTTTCDGTTKITATYSCDDKSGCISNIIREENNTDCGYVKKYSGKYTLEDVNLIKDIVINCKKYPTLSECYDTDKYIIYFGGITAAIVINTPFFNTLKLIDLKERTYESYSDLDIINGLNSNRFDFILGYDNSLGKFEKALFKSNGQIYNLEDISSDYSFPDTSGYFEKALSYQGSFSNFIDKPIEFVFLTNTNNVIKEYSVLIDLKDYK